MHVRRRYCNDIGDKFNLGKVLGKGQFGTTRIAVDRQTGEKYACKTVSKRKIVKKQVRQRVECALGLLRDSVHTDQQHSMACGI